MSTVDARLAISGRRAVMLAGGYSIVGGDAASVFCILWILKLGLHAPAFGTLVRVISNERAPIASVLIVFAILLWLLVLGRVVVYLTVIEAWRAERVAPAPILE